MTCCHSSYCYYVFNTSLYLIVHFVYFYISYPPILPRSLRARPVAWPFVFFTIPKIWPYLLNHLIPSIPQKSSDPHFPQFLSIPLNSLNSLILSSSQSFESFYRDKAPGHQIVQSLAFGPFAYHTIPYIPYLPYHTIHMDGISPNTTKYHQIPLNTTKCH